MDNNGPMKKSSLSATSRLEYRLVSDVNFGAYIQTLNLKEQDITTPDQTTGGVEAVHRL